MRATVDVRILGPVEVRAPDGERVAVGGSRPSSILLTLVLADGAAVSVDRLVHEVWGDTPPRRAVDTLQSYLSRLRRALEPDRAAHADGRVLVRGAAGYQLVSEALDIDARRFEAEFDAARGSLAAGRTVEGAARLRAALSAWRGPVGQGVDLGPEGRAAAVRLEELRVAAIEERLHAELALGHHAEMVGEIEALVATHPVRERLHGLRMLALYRSGRQAEALGAYREARAQLVDALGVEPSRQLAQLHERLLAHDPTLELTAGVEPPESTDAGITHSDTDRIVVDHRGTDHRGTDHRGTDDLGADHLGADRPAPLRDPRAKPPSLPAPLVDLVGRDGSRRGVAEALADARLVTLTGAGGCGKTQLALQVAHDVASEHPAGVWWIELQARHDPDLVLSAAAEALGVDEGDPDALLAELVARLSRGNGLLVLDNCEHLVDACASLAHELLVNCPDLRVLATSRQPLDVDGEVAWRVPSLSVPAVDSGLAGLLVSDAARLFERRAAAVRPGYRLTEEDAVAVGAICRELDGIPLAIELAAARVRVLSPEEVAARLDDRFAVLRSSRRLAAPRHRTLEATIAWSYDLLEADARRLLLRLAVFEGGFTVDEVECSCTDEDLPADRILELLEDLVDRSLVVTASVSVGPARHDLLQSIRSYARSHADAGDGADLARRHAECFAELAETAGARINGAEQVRWLNRLHDDQDNLRAALTWTLANDRADLALRIVGGAWWFWLQFGHAREGARWSRLVLEQLPPDADPGSVQWVTYAAGRLAAAAAATVEARQLLQRSLEISADPSDQVVSALARGRLAHLLHLDGSHAAAAAMLADARADADRGGLTWVRASLFDVSGHIAAISGDDHGAAAAFRESERCYLDVDDRWSACLSRIGQAFVARRSGDDTRALALHRQNLEAARSLTRSAFDFVGFARDLRGVAVIASARGAHEVAVRLCGASENLRTMGEVPLTPGERAEVDEVLAQADAALGADAVARAQAQGRNLAADAAIDEGLQVTEPGPVEAGSRDDEERGTDG